MFARWADDELRARVAHLTTELAKAKRLIAVQQAEIDQLSAVVARDRARVESEVAFFAKQRALAEGNEDYGQRFPRTSAR